MLRTTILSSGSLGNSILVEVNGICILLDAGLSVKTLKARLESVAYSIDDIVFVYYSHSHSDHFIEKTDSYVSLIGTKIIDENDLKISCFDLHHDVPCRGYRVEDNSGNVLVYITDTGNIPAEVYPMLRGANIMILEFNYESDMLNLNEIYSSDLKERIAENHLSNEQAHGLIASMGSDNLKYLFCHHLSSKNNTHELVEFAARSALHDCDSSAEVIVCQQDKATNVVTIM